jgi:hypothetical protein
MKPTGLLEEWNSRWKILAAIVGGLVPIIGNLVASPPTLWREAGDQPAFASLVVTIVIALIASSVMEGKRPSRSKTTGLALAAGSCVVVYFLLRAELSCPFAGDRMSIGWAYLQEAASYVAKNPDQGCSLLIADYIGNTGEIWPRWQVASTWGLVLIVYVVAVTLVAITLVRVMDHLRGA